MYSRPAISNAPAIEPITIPAICPPVNPLFPDPAVEDPVAVGVVKVIVAVMDGKTTPAHRVETSAL